MAVSIKLADVAPHPVVFKGDRPRAAQEKLTKGPKQLPILCQGILIVYDTAAILGIWNQNIGTHFCPYPYSTGTLPH